MALLEPWTQISPTSPSAQRRRLAGSTISTPCSHLANPQSTSSRADALSLVNTFQGLAVNWRKRRPILGNGIGGLSGPAIKPLALRIVWQVAQAVKTPIIGIGGIQSIDDVMEFLVCGAKAVQIGTANFYNPTLATNLVSELESIVEKEGCISVTELIGTLQPSIVASAKCGSPK